VTVIPFPNAPAQAMRDNEAASTLRSAAKQKLDHVIVIGVKDGRPFYWSSTSDVLQMVTMVDRFRGLFRRSKNENPHGVRLPAHSDP
jgi:hypothetical protein